MSLSEAGFTLISVRVEQRVCWATISAPPINVMTTALFAELAKLAEEVAVDDGIGALVLQSADPDFFIAHFDVEAILGFPTDGEPERATKLSGFHRMCETFRTMPKATIAKVAGRVGGGGAEVSASMDMRFGILGKTVINQMEVPLGILPGGTGTQRLPHLIGRGRAMEIVLGGVDLDARTAVEWGWLNRAFENEAELDAYVANLANRIASFPPTAVRLAKQSVLNALADPTDALLDEAHAFQKTLRDPLSAERMTAFLQQGGQTRTGELDVANLSGRINSV